MSPESPIGQNQHMLWYYWSEDTKNLRVISRECAGSSQLYNQQLLGDLYSFQERGTGWRVKIRCWISAVLDLCPLFCHRMIRRVSTSRAATSQESLHHYHTMKRACRQRRYSPVSSHLNRWTERSTLLARSLIVVEIKVIAWYEGFLQQQRRQRRSLLQQARRHCNFIRKLKWNRSSKWLLFLSP